MVPSNSEKLSTQQKTSMKVKEINTTGGNVIAGSSFVGSTVNVNSYETRTEPSKRQFIPRKVDRFFTGREDILSQIDQAFNPDRDCISRQERFVIAGLAGLGKSEICLKYAWDNEDRFHKIFWVDCQDQQTALTSFREIGYSCGLGEAADITRVKRYIANLSRSEPWLLVIDNADNTEVDYEEEYFPPSRTGHIILTTKDPGLIRRYGTAGLEIDLLEESTAVKLLLKNAEISPHEWPKNQSAARLVVKELDRHTLALVHAGSFIRESSCNFKQYLDKYRAKRDILFTNKRPRSSIPYEATFEVSIQFLTTLKEGGRTDADFALAAINLFAFMHYECHLGQIVWDGRQAFRRAEENLDRRFLQPYPRIFASSIDNLEWSMQWSRACKLLNSLSLIKCFNEDNLVASGLLIHQLVHTWLRYRLSLAEARETWYEAAFLLTQNDGDTQQRMVLRSLFLSSTIHCMKTFRESFIEADLNFVSMLLDLTITVARTTPGIGLDLDPYLVIIKQRIPWRGTSPKGTNLRIEKDQTVRILLLESQMHRNKGNYARGIRKLEAAVYHSKRTFGRTFFQTLSLRQELARMDQNHHQFLDAIALFELVAKGHQSLGNASGMLSSFISRSLLILRLGHLQEARNELELISAIREMVRIRDEVFVIPYFHLAHIYTVTSEFDRARVMYERVVEFMTIIWGEDHVENIENQLEFGRRMEELENWALATEVFKAVKQKAEKNLPQGHPTRVSCEESLARAQENQTRS